MRALRCFEWSALALVACYFVVAFVTADVGWIGHVWEWSRSDRALLLLCGALPVFMITMIGLMPDLSPF